MGGGGLRRPRRRPAPRPSIVSEKIKEEITREKIEIKKESVKRETTEKLRELIKKRIQTKVSKEIEDTVKRKILKSIVGKCGVIIASAAILLLAPVVSAIAGISLTQVIGTFETLRRIGVVITEGLANRSFAGMAMSIFSGSIAETIFSGMPLADEAIRGIASIASQKVSESIATSLGISGKARSQVGIIAKHAAEESIKEVIQETITEKAEKRD